MTMPQLVKDCQKVSGWNTPGKTGFEMVQHVLRSLMDEKLVALGTRFVATAKGREYLEDPLKWRIDERTTEELANNMFWKEIYDVFDKAYHRLRSKSQALERDAVNSGRFKKGAA
jgi:tRNA(His) 5'-end guanylyltransferase